MLTMCRQINLILTKSQLSKCPPCLIVYNQNKNHNQNLYSRRFQRILYWSRNTLLAMTVCKLSPSSPTLCQIFSLSFISTTGEENWVLVSMLLDGNGLVFCSHFILLIFYLSIFLVCIHKLRLSSFSLWETTYKSLDFSFEVCLSLFELGVHKRSAVE